MASVDVHVALENLKELAEDGLSRKRVRRPWLSFVACTVLAVCFFAAWGPITSSLTASRPVVVAPERQFILTTRRRASPTELQSAPAAVATRALASPPPPSPTPSPLALAAASTAAAAADVVRLEFKFTSNAGSEVVAAVRLKLLPEYSQPSVDFLRFAATEQCDGELYRSENNFLVQGRIACRGVRGGRNSVPKVVKGDCPAGVTPTKRQCPSHDPQCGCHGPIMSKGMVGWAGGSAGPDFFIYTAHMTGCAVGSCPATHWAHDHTVFATVADEQSWKTVETLFSLPVKRGGMTFFANKVGLTVKLDA